MNSSQVNQKNKEIWETNAKVWDDKMGQEGNLWHLNLVAPITEKMLELSSDDHILDIGCGNGIFSRRLAQKGYQVTAFDFSIQNIENAKKYGGAISYSIVDATIKEELNNLGDSFDKAVANMVLMDMPTLEVLFSFLNDKLSHDGCFVFSIQHPAFNSEFTTTLEDSITIKGYDLNTISKGVALDEQPVEQYYFHRPINEYSKIAKKYGFVIDSIEEPTLKNHKVYDKIPPIMIFKLIKYPRTK